MGLDTMKKSELRPFSKDSMTSKDSILQVAEIRVTMYIGVFWSSDANEFFNTLHKLKLTFLGDIVRWLFIGIM